MLILRNLLLLFAEDNIVIISLIQILNLFRVENEWIDKYFLNDKDFRNMR